jgi:hypothetical protein
MEKLGLSIILAYFQVQMNSQEPVTTPLSQEGSDLEEITFVPPAMSIEVSSKVSRM